MSGLEGHDPRLIRYLLGDLPPAEQEAIEEAYVSGDGAFQQLLAAEEELIDAYVAGALPEADRRRFEDHFLVSPERRQRTAFARTLARTLSAGPSAAPRRGAGAWLPAAAVLAAALAGGGWLLSRTRQLAGELQHARTQREAAALSHQDSQRRAAELDQQVGRLREQLANVQGSSNVTAWVLTPGQERGGPASAAPLSPAADWVRLQLRLDGGEYPRYRVAVLSADGKEIARFERLRARPSAGGRVVEVMLPAAALAEDTYIVTLAGTRESGAGEDFPSYSLRVVKGR